MDARAIPGCWNRGAGMDAVKAYGSPKSHELFNAFYERDHQQARFREEMLPVGAQPRRPWWVSSWANRLSSPRGWSRGIYPVLRFPHVPRNNQRRAA